MRCDDGGRHYGNLVNYRSWTMQLKLPAWLFICNFITLMLADTLQEPNFLQNYQFIGFFINLQDVFGNQSFKTVPTNNSCTSARISDIKLKLSQLLPYAVKKHAVTLQARYTLPIVQKR